MTIDITNRPLTANIYNNRPPLDLKEYEQKGGYMAVRKALKEMAPTRSAKAGAGK